MSGENSNDEDNASLQRDEIEALSAIYGDDFFSTDKDDKIYEVWIKNDTNPKWSASLRLVLPPGYPSKDPPVFEVQCLQLSSDDEVQLIEEFQQIAQENVGESFLFQWVEKLREIVEKNARERKDHDTASQTQEHKNTLDKAEELLTEDLVKALQRSDLQDEIQEYENAEFETIHGDPFTDRKSTFQAHLTVVTSRDEVDRVLHELKRNRKIANATHNIMAYRIFNAEKNAYIQDCDDDGENAAGSRLLHLLQITDVKDVIIVVTRWYGGLQLGPDRFKHINNCARNLLQSCGFIEGKTSNDNKDSKGKGRTKAKKR
ncbi:hypothetical protein QZH41_013609 [Actinostola sp. cb2023]|nr:hypothetical protein QZH41_013609 [Actinostola sp. cb2023]